MAEIDLRKTAGEMIRNGTWKFENGIFCQAFERGIAGYDGESFIFPDSWSRRERKEAKKKLIFILGLDTDLDSFYVEISDSPFAFLIDEFYGLTVPAAPSPYQALVETIAQQQVSFDFAQRAIENLVELAGRQVEDLRAFPSPERIASLSEDELKRAKLGYRAAYIKSLTELYLAGKLDLELWDWGVNEAIRYLTEFRGIGKWSAELFLAYGLRKNVYPAGDLGLRRGIAKIFGRSLKEVKEKDVREVIEPYGKWKGLLAFYILCYDRKTEMERKKK
ncbi:DNA-3-methyladenine glycosylase family protein [Thermococcus thioreducens]|uniref:3-methyladenine DNA glycosylase n=1 Tax=Thermococcus thioreducens TaxID=277988 RepID=A0A0Q2QQ80_9EURY|nr:DNA-3-methyladenine glycosylase [Thermococcus thioreducens]ASJ12903.1 3-methyladenine DNA glycosylase [Thermococcus thioreducens]KQH82093.1 3-methyladenine DNA glycosylase [Thermococcus thioreducens]SEV83625.1 DNA-3-methyladenine glycosylase II [Thermococcus thioreducens]